MKTTFEIIESLFNGIYYDPSKSERARVIDILETENVDSHSKATDICDYLGIERRGNRQFIIQLISTHS